MEGVGEFTPSRPTMCSFLRSPPFNGQNPLKTGGLTKEVPLYTWLQIPMGVGQLR